MRRVQFSIPIFLVYLALSGNLAPANLAAGELIALGISALFPGSDGPPLSWKRLPVFLWAVLRYVFVVILDILKGGISTARIVLDPKLPINPGIIAIPSNSQTELGAALSAHAISISPGELVVAMDDEGVLYVHCLDVANSSRYAQEAQALRDDLLCRMFE
jgi:multicomponent Na+:H+ antiporter subunit E